MQISEGDGDEQSCHLQAGPDSSSHLLPPHGSCTGQDHSVPEEGVSSFRTKAAKRSFLGQLHVNINGQAGGRKNNGLASAEDHFGACITMSQQAHLLHCIQLTSYKQPPWL